MIEESKLKRSPAPCAWYAPQDARNRNIANASHYSQAKKVQAEGIKYALELVYAAKEIHINYRKKFIAVKVDQARVKSKKDLELLENDWATKGITKTVTNQGVVYRIPA